MANFSRKIRNKLGANFFTELLRAIVSIAVMNLILMAGFYLGLPDSRSPVTDPKLMEYAREFEQDAESFGVEVSTDRIAIMEYVDLPVGTYGMCEVNLLAYLAYDVVEYPYLKIYIDEQFDTPKRIPVTKAITYHELGHCLLHVLEHDKERGTIMEAEPVTRDYYWEHNWDKQVEKLFTKYRRSYGWF